MNKTHAPNRLRSVSPEAEDALLGRRMFVFRGGAGLAAVGLVGAAGCTAGSEGGGTAGDGLPPGKYDDWDGSDGGADAETDAGELPVTCGEVTEPSIEGPFYSPGSPSRWNFAAAGVPGVRFKLRGRVLTPDCAPVANAILDFWQADDDGAYDNVGYDFRGHQFTDAQGRFALETIVPGHYLNGSMYRPAHIHVKVGGAGLKVLTTQLYFAGDPFNGADPFLHESLIMDSKVDLSGVVKAQFDFVVPRK